MIIDFPNMNVQSLPNFKGGEKEFSVQMFDDGRCKIMHGILVPGASIGRHTHETNAEILFVIAGCGTLIDDGETKPIRAGQCAYCPKGHSHSLINTEEATDLEFYATVPEQ
ncbi:MAG: cupin domain-containing protein [Paludibacteraceae bacterium]|nr:cupin domain-containing protein [Paludibacteraceae bacterium]